MSNVKRGDIYFINDSGRCVGSEQKAGRPAIVVSNDKCNQYSNVIEVVYITTRKKTNLPTHVAIRSCRYPSIALCEHVHSVSTQKLEEYAGTCTDDEMRRIDNALRISLSLAV